MSGNLVDIVINMCTLVAVCCYLRISVDGPV